MRENRGKWLTQNPQIYTTVGLYTCCVKTGNQTTESRFRHPLFDLRGTRKVEIRHTNFHFSSKKVTSKSRKVEVFDMTIVKKLSTFRPKKAKVEMMKSRKVEKLKSRKVEKLKS